MNKLVAIVGMSGTGKSVVTDYLEEQNWKKLYFGGITYKLMKEAGIERTEDGKSEKEFREKLRKDYGPECYAKFLEPEIKEALKEGFENGEIVNVYKENKYLFDAHIKIEPVSFTELHIDTSEEIIYDLHQDCEVEIRKCGK